MNTMVIDKKTNRIMDKLDDAYWACYRFIRDYVFEPYWYRFFGHKHHIIKTKLPPSPWYDTDIRMLYGVMDLVEWFVENDMQNIWSQEEFDQECKRIKEYDPEDKDGQLKNFIDQYERQNKIIEISNWWKNYPNREKEIHDALHKWCDYINDFQEDKDSIIGFIGAREKMNEEQKKEEQRLSDGLHNMGKKLADEEQEMLKLAVELRCYMWS